jgi:hypothetical protein
VQDASRGTLISGSVAIPLPGHLYTFQIKVDDLIYYAEYKAAKHSYQPTWVVNDPIELRLEKDNKMFLKRSDGKELEVSKTKRVRSE